MKCVNRAVLFILAAGLCAPLALAQGEKPAEKKPATPAPAAGQPGKGGDMKMPSADDMKKMQETMETYMKAAQPGKEHEFLKKQVGTWEGKVKSYEMPGQPPVESTCSESITSILGGRFTKCEVSGEMGGMGHFEGLGLYGYDNAQQKYTMAWLDNMGTGIMNGTGELSADGKTLTWTMNYVDPATKKAGTMREVDHFLNDNETHMEMYGEDPMEHKEMKMIEITFTRKMDAGKKSDAADLKAKPDTKVNK
jgi:hypothetical protein